MKIRITLSMLFSICFPLLIFSQSIVYPTGINQSDHFGRNVKIHGDYLFASDNNFGVVNQVYVFKKENGNWVEQAALTPDELTQLHGYGQSLDAYGEYVVVGSPNEDNDAGRAYVFKRTGDQWALDATLVSSDIGPGHQFGDAVAIHGTTIIVGASNKNLGNGAAYVFSLEGDNWVEKSLLDPGSGSWTLFGNFMSIDGDYAAISAHQGERVYIYHWDGTNWTEQAEINSLDANNNSFGLSVSIKGDRVIIGSHRDDLVDTNAGAAYIFKREGTNWNLEQKLVASDGGEEKLFGARSALSDNYAVICALYDVNNSTGAAYIFKREGNTWVEIEKYTAGGGDYFGWNTAIHENVAVVGAYASSIGASSGGAVYVYDLPVVSSSSDLENSPMDISVFPNPVEDYLNFKSETFPDAFSIINVKGETVKMGENPSDNIFVGNLSPGLYYLEVVFSDQVAVRKFIKE